MVNEKKSSYLKEKKEHKKKVRQREHVKVLGWYSVDLEEGGQSVIRGLTGRHAPDITYKGRRLL